MGNDFLQWVSAKVGEIALDASSMIGCEYTMQIAGPRVYIDPDDLRKADEFADALRQMFCRYGYQEELTSFVDDGIVVVEHTETEEQK